MAGTMSIVVGSDWTHANTGSFILVPGGTTHDFENRGTVRAGVLNISIPGEFEKVCRKLPSGSLRILLPMQTHSSVR